MINFCFDFKSNDMIFSSSDYFKQFLVKMDRVRMDRPEDDTSLGYIAIYTFRAP